LETETRMNSRLYECHVMHARFLPSPHRFLYRLFMLALDLDELGAVDRRLRLFSVNGRNLFSFRERDYLPSSEPLHNPSRATASSAVDRTPSAPRLKDRVVALLAAHGIAFPEGGRVELVTLPRVAGYQFNPVSFYFCRDGAGAPVAAIAEVTNTFREMKAYVLGPDALGHDARGPVFRLRLPKHFYVSPFSDVDVAFDFALRPPGGKLGIQIDDYAGGERTLTSTLAGPARPLDDRTLAWFSLKYPFLTLKVIALIHWHAFRLYLKRVPWFPKAARASDQRDLYRPHPSIASARLSDSA
jgi:DUF1365 family protein